jgi:hypothetical protein
MGEAIGVVVQRLLGWVSRRCFTALALWWTRQRRRSVINGLSHLLDRGLLESCFRELEARLVREERELCRVALLAWMDFVARAHGGELYRQFRELLPAALGLGEPGAAPVSICRERLICNEPKLCLKAYLLCKKRWMERELRMLKPGTPYARVARALLGESGVPEECGGMPEPCIIRC